MMPDNLKSLLVDDWEQVTKNQYVVSLPAKYPVRQILRDWYEEELPKRAGSSADEDVLEEVVTGLQEYFEKSLDKILLYRHERAQYRGLRRKFEAATGDLADKGPGDVYGAEHLIRLFSMYSRSPYSHLTLALLSFHSRFTLRC
jgi:mortality factor 4-like protein 1